MTATEPPAARTPHLVLLGAGHAHLHVLQGLAKAARAATKAKAASAQPAWTVTLISPHPHQLYSGMVPGFVAGHCSLGDCLIALNGLLANAGAAFIESRAIGMDPVAQTVRLADGRDVSYDWLSLDIGPVMDRAKVEAAMPGARAHALFVRPIEAFSQLWPQVMAKAEHAPLNLAVIGAGAAGLELAMAAAFALSSGKPAGRASQVYLITGGGPPARHYPRAVQVRVTNALRRLKVNVIEESCVRLEAGYLLLANGQRLNCDAPLLAIGAHAPAWLRDTGLELDAAGFVAVNAFQQSTRFARVFAVGDVASRVDVQRPRSGVYAVRAGPPLLANLLAAMQGRALEAYQPQSRTLNLLSCGERYAIGSWGNIGFEGRWVWRLKDWIDRRFVARHTKGKPEGAQARAPKP